MSEGTIGLVKTTKETIVIKFMLNIVMQYFDYESCIK